jgi:hypothetical protein
LIAAIVDVCTSREVNSGGCELSGIVATRSATRERKREDTAERSVVGAAVYGSRDEAAVRIAAEVEAARTEQVKDGCPWGAKVHRQIHRP